MSIFAGVGCVACQISAACVKPRAFFYDLREEFKHTSKTFFTCVLWAFMGVFSSKQRRVEAVFSVARGCQWRFRVRHDDMENVCYQLKIICFCAEWRVVEMPTITPRRRNRFSCASPSARATHCGKIGAKMLCHSLGISPHA